MPKLGTAAYRQSQREGPDATIEADAIFSLMSRSTALRKRLLVVALAGSVLGGCGLVALYLQTAAAAYGRVTGAAFAVGGLITFVILRGVSRFIARRFEAHWARQLARRHDLSAGTLRESLRVLD